MALHKVARSRASCRGVSSCKGCHSHVGDSLAPCRRHHCYVCCLRVCIFAYVSRHSSSGGHIYHQARRQMGLRPQAVRGSMCFCLNKDWLGVRTCVAVCQWENLTECVLLAGAWRASRLHPPPQTSRKLACPHRAIKIFLGTVKCHEAESSQLKPRLLL